MDCLRFIILVTLLSVTFCVKHQDPCHLKQTCGACIQEPKCFWCSDPSLNATQHRCSQERGNCNGNYTTDPKTNYTELRKRPLVSHTNNVSEVIQIVPQEVYLNLRINEPFNITLKYARAEYPVDLYYLMDLSYSMKDDKETLQSLGRNLEETMRKFTSDFRLGFGSFVDKTVRPYTNNLPSKIKEPCKNCTAPYGFHNNMKLSDNVTRFLLEVGAASVSGNVDDPEGGFDALMQTVVCSGEIGWRRNTRRLLIFSTDNGFHMAGDGKLGGIIEPNDGKCHLDKDGIYTHSTLQDYPSVLQLNNKVRENAINIIFAVTEPQREAYSVLTKIIDGTKVGLLTADSSNVLELVEEQYKKISSSVDMQHDAPEYIEVKYYTACQSSSKEVKESSKCDDLMIGEEVEFKVQIKVLRCPDNPSAWKQMFKIFPIGSQESIHINLEMNCDCSCEHQEYHQENAPECSRNGTYMCGICECNSMYFGKKCQCRSSQPLSAGTGIPSDCKPTTDASVPDCSEHGTCTCGVCQCTENFYGTYCECDDGSCKLEDGELCAGHGSCKCGKCQCDEDWTGEACDCVLSTESCRANEESEVCSGHGHCSCGTCQCDKLHTGKYCEDEILPVSQTAKCESLFPCVLCKVHGKGSLTPEQCATDCTTPISEVDAFGENTTDGVHCVHSYNDCEYEFQYLYVKTSVTKIEALHSVECQTSESSFNFIIAAVFVAIVILGLICVSIWKCVAVRRDRLEFIKFQNEQERSKWEVATSPLYKPPVTEFQNPVYGAVS